MTANLSKGNFSNNHVELHDLSLGIGNRSHDECQIRYAEYFGESPRYLFWAVDKKYGITNRILCDVGCSYGVNLFYCASGSYGVEIDAKKVEHANSMGMNVYCRDVVNDDLNDLPKVEVVWCSEVLEHLVSPHILLRKIHLLLKSDGLLVLNVPMIPLFPFLQFLPVVGKYISSYKVEDHIYAFVPKTLKFLCERAGFETLEISPFYPGYLGVLNKVPIVNRLLSKCVYVGKKINDWQYHDNASRLVAENKDGFVSKYTASSTKAKF